MITPEIIELGARGKQLMQKAYGRPGSKIDKARLHIGAVLLKVDVGVFSVIVKFESENLIIYIETPSEEYIGPPGGQRDLSPVLLALDILKRHMVLEDLAEIG